MNRKVRVVNFQSLDGVIQSVMSADDDRADGFAYGGWVPPYVDELVEDVMQEATVAAGALLLGRVTYENFAAIWPTFPEEGNPAVAAMNRMPKYVASTTLKDPSWSGTTVLGPDVPGEVAALKQQPGGDLVVFGSGVLLRTLLDHDLVDAYTLLTFPLILGTGKRMFTATTAPIALRLTETKTSPNGVLITDYTRES